MQIIWKFKDEEIKLRKVNMRSYIRKRIWESNMQQHKKILADEVIFLILGYETRRYAKRR